MFKKIFKPIQGKLIKKNLCPGCTKSLKNATQIKDITDTKKIVQCKCKRLYVWQTDTNTYKRATNEEEQYFLTKQKE